MPRPKPAWCDICEAKNTQVRCYYCERLCCKNCRALAPDPHVDYSEVYVCIDCCHERGFCVVTGSGGRSRGTRRVAFKR